NAGRVEEVGATAECDGFIDLSGDIVDLAGRSRKHNGDEKESGRRKVPFIFHSAAPLMLATAAIPAGVRLEMRLSCKENVPAVKCGKRRTTKGAIASE